MELDALYSNRYFDTVLLRGRKDAEAFAGALIDQYEPSYVVDLGCGVGRFIQPLHASGVDVYGVDGSAYAVSNPLDEDLSLDRHDLTEPLRLDREADVALCIEVLEHLPAESARTAIESIRDAAPVAIVTAAQPGQGGDYHVNERPREYWIDEFEAVGMTYDDGDVEFLRLHTEAAELEWLTDNLMVLRRTD